MTPKKQVDVSQVIKAVLDRDIDLLNSFMDGNDPDINASFEYEDHVSWTLLLVACRYGTKDMVVDLVERGADVHFRDEHGNTSLYWASCNEDEDQALGIAELLIERGVDVNTQADSEDRERKGRTALFGALLKGHLRLTEKLIEWGADVTLPSVRGESILCSAFRVDADIDLMQVLVEAGVGVNTSMNVQIQNSADGVVDELNTPLIIAAAYEGHFEVV